MRFSKVAALIALTVLLCSGCGSTDEQNTSPVSLGELSGSYELTDDCAVEFNASQMTIEECSRKNVRSTPPDGFDYFETLAGSGTIAETEVSFSGDYFEVYVPEGGEIPNDKTDATAYCKKTVEGSANRTEGRPGEEGAFEALAGEWEGTMTIQEECESPENSRDTTRELTFEASIHGQQAEISYSGDSFGSVELTDTEDGLLLGDELLSEL